VVLSSAEERRCNVKNFAGPPVRSITEILARSGVGAGEVTHVALGCRIRTTAPNRDAKKRIWPVLGLAASAGRWQWSTRLGQQLLIRLSNRSDLTNALKSLGINAPVKTYDHHSTHAACAYFHRPWTQDTLILTLDGAGDGLCATVSVGRGNSIEVLAETPKFHSIAAQLYSNITIHLGLKPYEHEYKVMGMAPYGQAEYCIKALEDLFEVDGLYFRNRAGRIYERMQTLLHKRLQAQRFDNIAAACQLVFERLVVQWVRNAVAKTGIRRLACAGGAFLNVKANKLIRELPEVEDLYVYPASDDGGTSVGAAILGYLDAAKASGVEPRFDLQADMYLGLEYTHEECLAAVRGREDVEYVELSNVPEQVADVLAARGIVARFSGREEWGPRALGNRSIICDPRDMGIIRKLNFAIKHRDFWMPFAASILAEDRDTYMQRCHPNARYMIEAFDTKQPEGEQIVAGTHPFDKTVRPQLVDELNPGYRDLIRAFKKRTGVGAVLNTSFNLHGSPIVGTPEVAVYTLLNSELDALLLGRLLVWRKGRRPAGLAG
jgi:carbamoyltransferase